ncbi:MAG: hypothetical protein KAY32_05705 [Candidatus Eisenbacteria sp.]|nr:hypothetical protein [Candidatus Eisenbacteria bacterium]
MRRPTVGRLFLLAALFVFASCSADDFVNPPPISTDLQTELDAWFAEHGRPPSDYVLGLFADHDVVLLGEQHRFRHDELFVQELIPLLHAEGVNTLATEFARRADQALADSLVVSLEWNEELGREILFRQFLPWGYREYLDVFKAAWRVNRDRPAGTVPFRILGVNNALDYSHFKSEADWNDPEVWALVAGDQTEADWAVVVLAAVEQGEKVLAHCGIHHAFTGFRQPRVVDGAFTEYGRLRFGNALRDVLGERAVTVYLHAPWNTASGYNAEYVHPADGRLDAFMLTRDGGPFEVGFDVAGSPLADLPIKNAVYKHGHEPFTLAEFCDGWVYTKPLSEYEPVTYIESWINESNVARARANAMNARWRDFSVAQLNAGCRSYIAEHRRLYGRLR